MSGMMAAHALIEGGSGSRHQDAIHAQYQEWIENGFMQDMNRLLELYRSHPFPPDWLPVR